MKVLENSTHLDLPDERVAVCGDWHNNLGWVRTIARALPILAPDITTILQLGDWGMKPSDVDAEFMDTDIDTVLVCLGNHENWGANHAGTRGTSRRVCPSIGHDLAARATGTAHHRRT